jgi:acyl-CoA synthetase (AMP-forming)/AMP-acid ligase II
MANLAELVVAYYACFRIGAIAAPLNTRLKTAELRPLLERLQPDLYIGQADLYRRIAAIDASIIPSNARFIVGDAVDDRWVQPLTKLREEGKVGPVGTLPDVHAPAVLLTTSGTTGQPKFVTHTQATLAASADSARHQGLDEDDIAAIALPMAHGFGLFTFPACIQFGTPVVLLERFDPDVMLDAIERHRCTWLLAVPCSVCCALQRQRARGRNVHSADLPSSGDVCPPQLQEQFSHCSGPIAQFLGRRRRLVPLTSIPGPVEPHRQRAEVRSDR